MSTSTSTFIPVDRPAMPKLELYLPADRGGYVPGLSRCGPYTSQTFEIVSKPGKGLVVSFPEGGVTFNCLGEPRKAIPGLMMVHGRPKPSGGFPSNQVLEDEELEFHYPGLAGKLRYIPELEMLSIRPVFEFHLPTGLFVMTSNTPEPGLLGSLRSSYPPIFILKGQVESNLSSEAAPLSRALLERCRGYHSDFFELEVPEDLVSLPEEERQPRHLHYLDPERVELAPEKMIWVRPVEVDGVLRPGLYFYQTQPSDLSVLIGINRETKTVTLYEPTTNENFWKELAVGQWGYRIVTDYGRRGI